MSNEYRDWFDDRAHEAWEDLTKIAEIVERWQEAGSGDGIVDGWFDIKNILEEGGWL